MIAVVGLVLVLLSLSQSQPVSEGTCYASRGCVGVVVSGRANDDRGECCVPGAGLSYNTIPNSLCQDCFSTDEFVSEGRKYYLGLFGNFAAPSAFRVGQFHVAVMPSNASQASFTVTGADGATNYKEAIEVPMSHDDNVVNDLSIRDRAVLVTSETNDPLSVILYDEEFTSGDAYKVLACVHLPVKSHYEYYAVSTRAAEIPVEIEDYENGDSDYLFEPNQGDSVLLIITCEKNTELNITLTQSVDITASDLLLQVPSGMFLRNVPVTIRLSNAGETLSISSASDLTGSRVTSDKPLTLISGHECGSVPYNINYCDKLVEQVPPTVTWGNTFITAPIAGRNAHDIFKLVAAQDGIEVTFSCTSGDQIQPFSMNKGEYRDIPINSSIYCFISSTGPVLLVQFSVGSNLDNVFEGDPFMVIIPPIEQYLSSYNISLIANARGYPEQYYVNLFLPDGVDSNGIRMNGNILNSSVSFTTIMCNERDSCGFAAQVKVSSGHYSLTHVNPLATFNAIVYWGSFRLGSGYFAGMTQRPLTLPRVYLASTNFEVFENQSVASVRCIISGSFNRSSNVRVSTIQVMGDIAAIDGEDFIAIDDVFVISPGQTELVVPIALVDDVFPEGVEVFEVLLSTSPGVFIDSPSRATVTILNDDRDLLVMNVSFVSTRIDVVEGQGVVMLELMKTEGALGPVSVQIAYVDGTAIAGEDYIAVSSTITFLAEELAKSVMLLILDNDVVENAEQLVVSITAIAGVFPVAVMNSSSTIFITDNDVVVIGFSSLRYITDENSQSVTVGVSILFGQLGKDVSVLFTTENGTARYGEDFEQVMSVLEFSNSQDSISQVVTLLQDNIVETDEDFSCFIGLVNGEDGASVLIFQHRVTVVIVDRDVAIIEPQVVQSAVREGGISARLAFSVLQGILSEPVILHFQTVGMDAQAGTDFSPVNVSISLINLLADDFLIEILDDNVYDGGPDEKFMVFMTLASGHLEGRVSVQPSFVEVAIEDNDPRPDARIGFSESSYVVSENSGPITIAVTSDGRNPEIVTMQYLIITGGSGPDGVNTVVGNGELSFPPLSQIATVSFPILDDSEPEPNQTFTISLQPSPGIQIALAITEVTVMDNDAVQILFERMSYTTDEGGQVALKVRKIGQVRYTINIILNTESGTALEILDFVPKMMSLSFAPTDTELTVTIDIISDDILENVGTTGELFLVRLTALNNPIQVDLTQNFATIIIVDSPVILSPPELLCSAGTTRISCTWTQPITDTVTNYLLSWNYNGPCTVDAQSFLLERSARSYVFQGLQEGGDYDVSLFAVNGVDQGPRAMISVNTDILAPTGPPQFVRSTRVGSDSISLRWDHVSCLDRNGPIELYIISYGLLGSSQRINVSSTSTTFIIANLVSDSSYVVQVAASNAAGVGPYSQPLILVLPIEVFDECAAGTDSCDENAECIDTRASFICRCVEGFVGDGLTCTAIQACGSNPCDSNADCTDIGDGLFTCDCFGGFTGDGLTCLEIDECLDGGANCDLNAVCSNNIGSFECFCNVGFSGDGVICEDIDECVSGQHNCGRNALCNNIAGSFTCECEVGFIGNGITCSDIDECISGQHNCGRNAVCNNTAGGFSCECEVGYIRNGTTCIDIDECVSGQHNCGRNAMCNNTVGSFTCECEVGFIGNGFTCSDIDECVSGQNNCGRNAVCTNTAGSFTCECEVGFTGDGITCSEDVSYIVGFERTSYNVSETVGFFGVSVTVTGRSTIPIIVDVSSVDGTATAGSDYAAVQQILFFLPGVSSLEVQVLIIADAISEEIESFSLRLTTPGPLLGGQLDPSTAQVFIYDGVSVCPQGAIRLQGGTSTSGRVEVCNNNVWGTVCDDGWQIENTEVACRQLGLSLNGISTLIGAAVPDGTGQIWLDEVRCTGTEIGLINCSTNLIGIHDCSHTEDIGVSCQVCLQGAIRLQGGTDSSGRVEICNNNVWGTVCDDGWGTSETEVACRQLGLPFVNAIALTGTDVPNGIGQIWLDDVECIGTEISLFNCTAMPIGVHNCRHIEDIGVNCQGSNLNV